MVFGLVGQEVETDITDLAEILLSCLWVDEEREVRRLVEGPDAVE